MGMLRLNHVVISWLVSSLVVVASGQSRGSHPAGLPTAVGSVVSKNPRSNLSVQLAELTASDGALYDSFALSVAASGDTVVVGASGATINSKSYQGAAYVFVKPAGGWTAMTQTAKLTASDGLLGDQL